VKLQTNTLLAIYSVIEFAADPARTIAAAEIAQKHGVSAHHLAKVLSELARASVVESVRGAGGGYRFAGNARRLTLMDIIRMFEDLDSRPAPRARADGPRALELALSEVLGEIDDIARSTFSSITIATMLRLVDRHKRSRA
jgi:Rrf2 family protein